MKLNYGSRCRSLALVLGFTITLAAQVNISEGLQCYLCLYAEKDESGGSSATCEKNPTSAELYDMSRSSQMKPAALEQILTALRSYQGISLTPSATAPNASAIITVSNPDKSSMAENTKTGIDATYLYCLLTKFNHKYLGRVVVRLAAEVNKDVGATYCDKIPPSDIEVVSSEILNVNSCYCKSSRCNGKDISGAEKAGQSIALFLFSIGLAILGVNSFRH